MALTNREKRSLAVVFLISGALILVFVLASRETRSLLYSLCGVIVLPLASVRIMLAAIKFFKAGRILLTVIWSVLSILMAILVLVPLSELRNILHGH